jgi:N-acetyl-gamma-glutamyl-phosphate reductase
MIKVGIVGSNGYVGGELIRIALNHPEMELDFLYSRSQDGQKVMDTHQDLFAFPELKFTDKINENVDVVFLSLGHGNSSQFLHKNKFSASTKIIDLSNDFRLQNDALFEGKQFVYGLPELNRKKIKNAQFIANPGCFATAIQLALLPLAQNHNLSNEIHIHALTGSTGAGQSLNLTTAFNWRNNNISIYKAFKHQHLGEIKESLLSLQSDFDKSLNFIPIRGDFTRGIFATVYFTSDVSETDLTKMYKEFYKEAAFTFCSQSEIHLKQVVNTNNCLIQVQKLDDKVLINSAIDNLLKGAAGQAIQNMNLMFGLDEKTGLNFKANYY